MMSAIKILSEWLIAFAQSTGYWGFFVVMVLESTSIPVLLPAEIVLISAGYLVGLGRLNFYFSVLVCTLGSLCGALINYYLAFFFGRKLIERYGKYVFISKKSFSKFEVVFNSRSGLITFIGRFVPFIKHIVSIPPGLSRMNVFKFMSFTSLGSLLLNIVMIQIGSKIGEEINSADIKFYLEVGVAIFVLAVLLVYYLYNRFANQVLKKQGS